MAWRSVWLLALVPALWSVGLAWYALHPPLLAKGLAVGLTGLFVLVAVLTKARSGAILLLVAAASAILFGILVQARNDRSWSADVARPAWAERNGDWVSIHNYRRFDWKSASEAVERWETKTVRISQLQHVDLFMVYWGSPVICHTMVSFDFGSDGVVCVSVEARREEGESYSPLAGALRGYELFYVFGDEHDLVRVRTNFRANNEVYLFRLAADAAAARTLFSDFLRSANEIRERPTWYNSFTTNCTTVIRQHAAPLGLQDGWSWRLLANGYSDTYLYEHRYISQKMPLPELKARSRITDQARPAGEPNFSRLIRSGLPDFEF